MTECFLFCYQSAYVLRVVIFKMKMLQNQKCIALFLWFEAFLKSPS